MGCYQEGIAKTKIGEKDVTRTAHVYEYPTQISITPSLKTESADKALVPSHLLPQREKPKEDQLPWLVLQHAPAHTPTQRL